MFDFTSIRDNISTQVIIILSIVTFVLIIVGLVTQGFARTIATVFGVIILIALILMLKDAEKVGTWFKNQIFKPGAGMILPSKGVFSVWNITIQESLNNLSKFIR